MTFTLLSDGDDALVFRQAWEESDRTGEAAVVRRHPLREFPQLLSPLLLGPLPGRDRTIPQIVFDFPVPFDVRHGGTAVETRNLGMARIERLGLALIEGGAVGFDKQGVGDKGSSSLNVFDRLWIEMRGRDQRGFRSGQEADDDCANTYLNCFIGGTDFGPSADLWDRVAYVCGLGNVAWDLGGGNHFADVWIGPRGGGCRTYLSMKGGTSAHTVISPVLTGCGEFLAIDGQSSVLVQGGRLEGDAKLLTHGAAFNVGAQRGIVTLQNVVSDAMAPERNKALGLGPDGVVVEFASAGTLAFSGQIDFAADVPPKSPILLASAVDGGSVDMAGVVGGRVPDATMVSSIRRGAWRINGTPYKSLRG